MVGVNVLDCHRVDPDVPNFTHFCTLFEVTCVWKEKLLTMCCYMFNIFCVRRASQDD